MPHASFLIKPASSLCNMRCRYCFYEDEAQSRTVKSNGIMSDDTAAILIQKALDYAGPQGSILFNFQGGEPTLAGAGFFHFFTEEVGQRNRHRIPVFYGIQTNGYRIDQELMALFRQHRFLVGVSLDGNKAIHDHNRLDVLGQGTFQTVVQNASIMTSMGIDVNLLCVVTRSCARNPQKVYRSMKELGFRHFQFIPCLDPLAAQRGSLDYSLSPELYGKFLCGLFDSWYADWRTGQYVSIRFFEDMVYNLMGLRCGTCASSGQCGQYLVVESDGSAYPCDFYCLDEWYLGNIQTSTVQELLQSEKAHQFLSGGRSVECRCCSWYAACRGGCKRDYFGDPGKEQNYYCLAFQRFFAYAWPRLTEVVQREQAARRGLY